MVKSLVSKLSNASSLSLASTLSSVGGSGGHGNAAVAVESNYAKHRNDPGRFFGDGVQFKAKLIGILEVGEARGDRMCQEALQDLKMAIRAAGEHKQRITIHVTIDGLRLRDEKTGDSLYHHPVHKISFIAQDMTDSRAFGYIFGSPDSGHRFFGIKTDKAASQVVLAMRDLFQVVFELKKKEIELARQQIQSKSIHEHQLASLSSLKSAGGHNDLGGAGGSGGVGSGASSLSMLGSMGGGGGPGASGMSRLGVNLDSKGMAKELSPESVADLVDLEQELSSLQRGITQMERITPSEPTVQPIMGSSCSSGKTGTEEDPFGDSFTKFPTYNILPPPPESGRSRNKPNKPPESNTAGSAHNAAISSLLSPANVVGNSSPATLQPDEDDTWLHELDQQNDVFDTSKTSVLGLGGAVGLSMAPLAPSESTVTPTQQLGETSALADMELPITSTAAVNANASLSSTAGAMVSDTISLSVAVSESQSTARAAAATSDAFTDLDPLGIGRTRPYVDKKYFFHELKNPPKKVLKDLSSSASCGGGTNADMSSTNYTAAAAVVDEFLSKEGLFDDTIAMGMALDSATTMTDLEVLQQQLQTQQLTNVTTNTNQTADPAVSVSAATTAPVSASGDPVMLPRDTDPFSPTRKKSDPFQEGDIFANLDPFEFEFPTKSETTPQPQQQQHVSPTTTAASSEGAARRSADVFNGPLQVQLPPESGARVSPTQWKGDISRLERQSSESPANTPSASAMGNNIRSSTVRSRPTPSGQLVQSSFGGVHHHAASSVFKQQTADVISSISSKKMPQLFGQARFSKRESNSINMRRLQESDSLSENETAPEPPPRPDTSSHAEPPPLPPKKQFNDIVIRPRVTSGNAVSSSSRYEFLNSSTKLSPPVRSGSSVGSGVGDIVPPIPLPSRRVGRSDGTYPGPGRPRKPGHTEDDYLAPISSSAGSGAAVVSDVPPLLPPPAQTGTRGRTQRQQSLAKAHDLYENKSEILQHQKQQQSTTEEGAESGATAIAAQAAAIPDITLSQLLTLGIDELAIKLNVPTSKLSTMTLVELTLYLSEFIEKSKPSSETKKPSTKSVSPGAAALARKELPSEPPPQSSSVFKVNFDQQATFVAKFDDTFGEDMPKSGPESFVANFAQFNEPPPVAPLASKTSNAASHTPAVPSADRYAVFREIIDQELHYQQQDTDLMGDITPPDEPEENSGAPPQLEDVHVEDANTRFEAHFDEDDFLAAAPGPPPQQPPPPPPPRIDTNITEVVAQAKDRYAALRDIILVENLFEKPPPVVDHEQDLMQEFPEFSDEFNEDQDLKHIMDDRASSAGRADRIGLVDSRGFPAEPSSSALTVDDDEEDEDGGAESSLDSNDKDTEGTRGDRTVLPQDQYEQLSTSNQQLDVDKSDKAEVADLMSHKVPHSKQDSKFLTVAGVSGLSASKDDLEIDELMQRAISNLSLDSRDRISPANSTNATTAALPRPSRTQASTLSAQSQQFNDMSTSPIPLQKSPVPPSAMRQKHSPLAKSPQASPILSQLSAVSNLIDTATKQMGTGELLTEAAAKASNESWATFDSPKSAFPAVETAGGKRSGRSTKSVKSTSLHLPPPPPSNTSQNDTAESPCSSDPRDDGWSKGVGTGGGSAGRRWAKKERQQTSSSSRDLSPWDDEDYQKQKRMPLPSTQSASQSHTPHADRHGYYMRHARRMNSCDEDYDYEEDFSSNRRDHRKLKQGISRSRDNFDLDSPNWYHHPPHHTWSPQDIEQAAASRARSFERSAYERSTYGPPIYDKRGVALPAAIASSYDRRSGYDKRKYYRDYARPNYDFDEYGESPPMQEPRYRDAGSFEKLKVGRRSDYENVYDDGRSPMGYKSRATAADYMYERDRKSFDRESVESFESASRRRRSFGSGDVYGSLESREDFRDRYMGGGGPEKTRSLRKGMKLRATGDIDYEQDSENDFHQRPTRAGGAVDARSLQRPSQLAAVSSMSMTAAQSRMRKSSGSSPWDGEEPPLPGQKSWKRPSSAADSERRLAESRRAATLGQTPSGSDGEKDRRFRKKSRARGKELPPASISAIGALPPSGRYGSNPVGAHMRDNYDYITYDDDDDEEGYVDEEYDEPPTDEDKFERLNRRRHEMHQRMLESERRQQALGKVPASTFTKCLSGSVAVNAAAASAASAAVLAAAKKYHASGGRGGDYDFDDYEQTPTPRSLASTSSAHPTSGGGIAGGAGDDNKFNFDAGFESDFNQSSPPPAPAGTASSCNSTPAATVSATATPATKSSFRFSNDFSDREKLQPFAQNSTSVSSLQQFELDTATSPASHATPPIQKLRFDDNVKVSQFDDASAFEDDFSKAQFDFEKEDQWHAESLPATSTAATVAKKHNLRNSKLQQRQELIKKSESINIFAKKAEDPFEDDEFFKESTEPANDNGTPTAGSGGNNGNFQWDDDSNFAKFDENM